MGLTKSCSICKREQVLDCFYIRKDKGAKHRADCITCCNARRARWNANNPDFQKIYDTCYRKQRPKVERKTYREKLAFRVFKKERCEACGFMPDNKCQLDVDHKDGDHTNNSEANLQTLCANCHRLKTWLNREGLYRRMVA